MYDTFFYPPLFLHTVHIIYYIKRFTALSGDTVSSLQSHCSGNLFIFAYDNRAFKSFKFISNTLVIQSQVLYTSKENHQSDIYKLEAIKTRVKSMKNTNELMYLSASRKWWMLYWFLIHMIVEYCISQADLWRVESKQWTTRCEKQFPSSGRSVRSQSKRPNDSMNA